MNRLLLAVLLSAALASCAPILTSPPTSAPYATGEEPIPPGETRAAAGTAITRSDRSALEPRLTYPGNAYGATFEDAPPTTAGFTCAATEHHLWFKANGARLEADTTARLGALGYLTDAGTRSERRVTVAASNGRTILLLDWTIEPDVTIVSTCRIAMT